MGGERLREAVERFIGRVESRGTWAGMLRMSELEMWVNNDLRPALHPAESLYACPTCGENVTRYGRRCPRCERNLEEDRLERESGR